MIRHDLIMVIYKNSVMDSFSAEGVSTGSLYGKTLNVLFKMREIETLASTEDKISRRGTIDSITVMLSDIGFKASAGLVYGNNLAVVMYYAKPTLKSRIRTWLYKDTFNNQKDAGE